MEELDIDATLFELLLLVLPISKADIDIADAGLTADRSVADEEELLLLIDFLIEL